MEDNIRKKRSLIGVIVVIAAVIVLCGILAAVLVVRSVSPAVRLEKQLTLGAKYLNELDYEQAIVAYRTAIEIDPKSTDAYIGLADAYVGLQDYDEALAVLNEGYDQTGDDRIKDKIHEIEALIVPNTPDTELIPENNETGTDDSDALTDPGELKIDQMFEVRGWLFRTENIIPEEIEDNYFLHSYSTYGVKFENGIELFDNNEVVCIDIADVSFSGDEMCNLDKEAYLDVPCVFYGRLMSHDNIDGPASDGGYHFDPYEYEFEICDIISSDEVIQESAAFDLEEMTVSVIEAQRIDDNNVCFESEYHATEALDVRIAAWQMEPWTHEEIKDQWEFYSDEWSNDEVVLLEPDLGYIQGFPLGSDEQGEVYVLLFGRNEDGNIVAYSVIVINF